MATKKIAAKKVVANKPAAKPAKKAAVKKVCTPGKMCCDPKCGGCC
jgi:hypothetical protein